MADRENTGSAQPENAGGKGRTKGTRGQGTPGSRRKKFLAWSTGVLAATSATFLVVIATNGANAVYHFLNGNNPLLVSPASVSPAGTTPKFHAAMDLTRYDVEFFLPGNISIKNLPKVVDLRRRTLGPPVTSWDLSLNISGTDGRPVVITGMSVKVTYRAPPFTVTKIHSCWLKKCTPINPPQLVQGSEEVVRHVLADLDVPTSDVRVQLNGRGHFPFIVTDTNLEYFVLNVIATQCSCKFVVLVNWAQGGRSGQELIDHNGQPFQVITERIARQYCYDRGRPRGYADVRDQKAVHRLCEA